MDATPSQRGRAYIADWEQECCGNTVLRGATADVVLLPFPENMRNKALGAVDWLMSHHDDGAGEAGPSWRVRVRVERVQAVHGRRGSARLVELDRLPGRAEIFAGDDADGTDRADEAGSAAAAAGFSFVPRAPGAPTVSYEASYESALPQRPRAEGWLLDLEILEDLGSQVR